MTNNTCSTESCTGVLSAIIAGMLYVLANIIYGVW